MAVEGLTFESRSPEATEALAHFLGQHLLEGTLVTLDGDLGSGKTCFVRGLAAGLGVEDPVTSPTYTLMQELVGGRLPLYHFDAWMEGREKALLADGGDAWLSGDGIAVVEWAERIADYLPEVRLSIHLDHRAESIRQVRLAALGEPAGGALTDLLRALPPIHGLVAEPSKEGRTG
jgi:tRNA threonylcarbamoyladenosine biosynthesis protein TsaE